MDGLRHLAVHRHLVPPGELRAIAAAGVRRDAAGDDHADAAFHPLDEVGSKPLGRFRAVFQPGVHRTHDDAVLHHLLADGEG